MTDVELMDAGWLNFVLYLSYFLVAFAALAAIVLPLIKSLDNPKSLLHLGGGILGIIILFGIAYALADNEVLPRYAKGDVDTPELSQFIGASLITMYVMLFVAVASILFTEVAKIFR